MPDRYWIDELPQHANRTVAVRGWVATTRSSGKIAFVVVRDGTGYLQAVLSKKDVAPEVWEALGK
ncbi:MAG TPA: OB-fold nucleic acid binding domain-containing protein, partial [Gemmatimonadales bacterium]|nr:OB-fold nucleic acid binding domain-containing protein [Gemmatimonadales bacterium]